MHRGYWLGDLSWQHDRNVPSQAPALVSGRHKIITVSGDGNVVGYTSASIGFTSIKDIDSQHI